MLLNEVDVIKELFSVQEVNQALTQGWRLVAVTTSAAPSSPDMPAACYILGKKIKPPKVKITAEAIANAHNSVK